MLYFPLLVISALGQDPGPNPAVALLNELAADPKRQVTFDEGMKVSDAVRAMPAAHAAASVPVILEALRSGRETARVWAASFLFAASLRPDAETLLDKQVAAIIALLQSPDERLQRTAPAVLARLRSRSAEAKPALEAFLHDASARPDVQVAVACTLNQLAEPDAAMRRAFGAFLSRPMAARDRIEALNGVACRPSDDPDIARLVSRSLSDPDADVRARAVAITGRLGPKSVASARGLLVQIANREGERPDVRALASGVLAGKW